MCRNLNITQLQTTTPGWLPKSYQPGDAYFLLLSHGNITNRSDIGDYSYNGVDGGLHAVTDLTNTSSNLLPQDNQYVDYTDFNKVSYITQGNYSYFINYGPDRLRRRTRLQNGIGDDVLLTKHYAFGDYEKETDANGTRHLHYISGGDGLAAIYIKYDSGVDSLYYPGQLNVNSSF